MTLPFRRRHHDDEGTHDRARALTSRQMLEPLDDASASWLTRHLSGCLECRNDRDAYLADRDLLRSLRDRAPTPPRDLWARTSAALDRESQARQRRGAGARGSSRRGAWRRLPFGAAAGALLVLVVVGVSIYPNGLPPNATPGASAAAGGPTSEPEPTNMAVAAGRVGWVRPADGGAWELVLADINEVCPRSRPNCRALIEANPGRRIDLGNQPLSITISPELTQAVVESRAHGTAPDQIFVVPVASETPTVTAAPTVTPAATSTAAPATPEPPATTEGPTSSEPPASDPPSGSPEPSPENPVGAIEIASGVTVVGEAAYSTDGTWLAFSARPSDGSTGPDLYLWRVGEATAIAVTTDHRTYFSAWLDGRVLASRVLVAAAPTASDEPVPSSDDPTNPSEEPSAAPQAPVEAHPISFLLDPATLAQSDIAQPDVWLPVVDPTGRFVAYWSGTLLPTDDGLDWHLATGELVLDGWSDGETAAPTAEATVDPLASGEPAAALGPKGSPVPIVDGDTAAFKSKFDPTGTRLAVWVGEQLDAGIGRLHLIVLDPETGTIDSEPSPLAGVPALRRFSIDTGRVAWVTPSGQDGQESAVQVLGWSKDDFGEIRTIPAKDLFIVR